MKNKTAPSVLLVAIAFTTVYVVWGSTYFFIQKALAGFQPFVLGALRFLASGSIMLIWCIIRKEKVFYPAMFKTTAITGIMLLFVAMGTVLWMEQFMPSGVVAITVSAAPIWFILPDKPMWKENFGSTSTIVGLVIGFCGVLLLFGEQVVKSLTGADKSRILWGSVALIIGSMFWSGGSLYAKHRSKGGSATASTAWQMIFAGLAYIPATFITGEWQETTFKNVPMQSWLSVLYLVFMGSIAAYSAYMWLLQVRPATQVSTYAYVNPVIAVVLGVFFGHERISWLQIGGLAVILVSVLLINLRKYMTPSNRL